MVWSSMWNATWSCRLGPTLGAVCGAGRDIIGAGNQEGQPQNQGKIARIGNQNQARPVGFGNQQNQPHGGWNQPPNRPFQNKGPNGQIQPTAGRVFALQGTEREMNPAVIQDFAENQEETQDPEGGQYYPGMNLEVRAELEYAWDPYQT